MLKGGERVCWRVVRGCVGRVDERVHIKQATTGGSLQKNY